MSDRSSFVWSLADMLRGPYKPNQYGLVILPFTILRRLECVMEPHRDAIGEALKKGKNETTRRAHLKRLTRTEGWPGLSFWNTSAYTLAKALEDPDNLAANLIDYLNGFSSDIDVFKNFAFESIIKELDEHDRLTLITSAFAKVDLSMETVDNAAMGDLFENLIYQFAEASNEKAGDFYTPRDVVRLLVDLVFVDDVDGLRESGVVRSVYDPTAGTGGMLSIAEEHLLQMNSRARLALFGQEINKHSYAICKSDLLVKGQDIGNIVQGDTLKDDKFASRKFDYILSNPPFGQDWKASEKAVRDEYAKGERGRFAPGLPSVDDGAMLFLLHVASKLRTQDEFGRGGRAGIVLSGSPLFTGSAGQGPSNIRGWMLEMDLVDAIIALPGSSFYNTDIGTYLWILTNTKASERVGKVQLIDASGMATKMRKNLGRKRVAVSDIDRGLIVEAYANFAESEISKIFDNRDFAYWEVTVERPLRLNFKAGDRVERISTSKPLSKVAGLAEALADFGDEVYVDREGFVGAIATHLASKGLKLAPAQKTALWKSLGERDSDAPICVDKHGNAEPDVGLRDTEIVPFGWGGFPKDPEASKATIAAYLEAEVLPHAPGAWTTNAKIGYEIPLTRHFYKYIPPRPIAAIDADLDIVAQQIIEMLHEVEA